MSLMPPVPRLLPVSIAAFLAAAPMALPAQVVINEVLYHPASENEAEEFLELHNPTGSAVNIAGWTMSDGIAFTFPGGTSIPAGGFLVLSPDLAAFGVTYGTGSTLLGPYTGKLANGGERVALSDTSEIARDEVTFGDAAPWPVSPDGGGPSLELIAPALDNSLAASWQASAAGGGTPGRANSGGGREPPFVDLFARESVLDFRFTFPAADWFGELDAIRDTPQYLEGTFQFGGFEYPGTGARLKGGVSLDDAPGRKRPLRIEFDAFSPGQRFMGVETLKLTNSYLDPTFMREVITADIARELGPPVPRYAYADVTINGEHVGLYVLQENVDADFLDRQFGSSAGNLFESLRRGSLQYLGEEIAPYQDFYELQTNESANDWTNLIGLCRLLQNTPDAGFSTAMDPLLDQDAARGYLALNIVMLNLDSYLGFGKNYYLYDDPSSGRFVPILWDMNFAFGVFSSGYSRAELVSLDPYTTTTPWLEDEHRVWPMTRVFGESTGGRAAYDEWLLRILNGPYTEEGVQTRITALDALIGTAVQNDPNLQFTYQQYLQNQHEDIANQAQDFVPGVIPGLTRLVRERRAALMQRLSARHRSAIVVQ